MRVCRFARRGLRALFLSLAVNAVPSRTRPLRRTRTGSRQSRPPFHTLRLTQTSWSHYSLFSEIWKSQDVWEKRNRRGWVVGVAATVIICGFGWGHPQARLVANRSKGCNPYFSMVFTIGGLAKSSQICANSVAFGSPSSVTNR